MNICKPNRESGLRGKELGLESWNQARVMQQLWTILIQTIPLYWPGLKLMFYLITWSKLLLFPFSHFLGLRAKS